MMSTTYVVTGEYRDFEELKEKHVSILYVGSNKEKAEAVEVNIYESLNMEIWVNEALVKASLKKDDGQGWKTYIDKTLQSE